MKINEFRDFEHNSSLTDKLFPCYDNAARFEGILKDAVDLICENQLFRTELGSLNTKKNNNRHSA